MEEKEKMHSGSIEIYEYQTTNDIQTWNIVHVISCLS